MCREWWLKLIKFPFKVAFEAVFAIFILAVFFQLLASYNPNCYEFLTKWVNQPYIPSVTNCSVKKMDSSDLKEFDDTKDFERSCLTIKFNKNLEIGDKIFVQQQVDKGFLFKGCSKKKPGSKDKPYLLFSNAHPIDTLEIEYVNVNPEDSLKEGQQSPENCPLDPMILRRKK